LFLTKLVETFKEKTDTISSFIDEEESIQRKTSLELNSKPEIIQNLPESLKNEKDEILNKCESPELKDDLTKMENESIGLKPSRLIKATMFSIFDYNGESTDITREIKKSLRRKFKDIFYHNTCCPDSQKNRNFLLIVWDFVLIVLIFIINPFLFLIRKLRKIESKSENNSILNNHVEMSDMGIANTSVEKESPLSKGNFIRISSVFNAEKKEVFELLMDFSTYALVDKNVQIAEPEDYYNQIGSNISNDNQVKTQYYSIVYKEKYHFYKKKGLIANKRTSWFKIKSFIFINSILLLIRILLNTL